MGAGEELVGASSGLQLFSTQHITRAFASILSSRAKRELQDLSRLLSLGTLLHHEQLDVQEGMQCARGGDACQQKGHNERQTYFRCHFWGWLRVL